MKISEFKAKFFPQETHLSYQLTKLTIISPFFSEYFFEHLVEADVLLVTDFRSKLDADKISLDFPNIKCVLSETNATKDKNIVHAKIFFFEWKNVHVGETRFILLWGSCNATFTELSGGNAEVYSWCDVSRNYPEVINYFGKIRELSLQSKPSGQISSVETQLKTVSLYLPALRLIENINDFESWLESGFLWHPSRQRPFGTLRAKFKKPLAQELTAVIREDSHLKVADQKSISYSYLEEDIKKNLNDIQFPEHLDYLHNTKEFSVETIYGLWISKEFKESFTSVKDNDKQKLEIVNRIKNSTLKEQEEWIKSFFNQLQHSLDKFIEKVKDKNPSEYFHLVEDGQTAKIDEQQYQKKDNLNGQIAEDISLCNDISFKNSYLFGLSGGNFSAVPPIRFCHDAWNRFPKENSVDGGDDFVNSFVSSWCQNLFELIKKKNRKNRLSILMAKLSKNNEFTCSKDLYRWLQEDNWRLFQSELRGYYLEQNNKNNRASSGTKSTKKINDDKTGDLFGG
jgi:hypothetical protein